MNYETSASFTPPRRPWWHVRPELLQTFGASLLICVAVWSLALLVVKSVKLPHTWNSTARLLTSAVQ